MSEQLNYQINIGGNATESIGNVKKQLKEANAELIDAQKNFGEYSNEAIAAAKRVAQLRDSIQEARETADLFDPGKKFQALSNTLSAVAGGFAAVQGAIGLFGSESKELEKQLLKVQSALALSQGLSTIADSAKDFQRLNAIVQSSTIFMRANAAANTATAATMKALGIAVDTTTTSFRVLKTAIAATGIGLAVIAIGELISAISNYTSAAEKAKEAQDKLNESIKKSAEGALQAEIDQINRSNDLLVAQAKLRGASEKEIFEIEQSSRKLRIAARNRFNKEVETIDKEAAMKNAAEIRKEQDSIVLSEVNFQVAEKDRKKKHNDELLALEKERTKKEQEELEKRQQGLIDAAGRALNLQLKSAELKTEAQTKQAEADDAFLAAEFEKENIRAQNVIDQRNKVAANDLKASEMELQARIQLEDAKFAAASAGLNALGALVGQNEKLANAIFVVDKALAIAKVVIDTQREIASISSNPFLTALPDLGASIKIPAIAGAKIRAAAGIATIAATTIAKFKGGASASNFGQGGAINTTGSPIIPTQQVQLTQLNQQSINAIGNSAIRAYVVETDITGNQKRIQAIKQRARFG